MEQQIPEVTQDNETEVTGDSQITTEQPEASTQETAPAYQPNYKYSVMDVEKEFDDRLKGLIKSEEDEKWVRDLVTRAEGMENDKRSYSKLKDEHAKIKSEYEQIYRDVNNVLKMRDNGDLGALFGELGVKKEDILKYAYQLAQYQDLTPDQRAYYDRQQELQRSHYQAQQQNEILMNELRSIKLQTSQSELINKLNNQDISPIVKQFDARNGQNAFYNEVVRRGAMYEAQFGQTKQADELIQEIVNLYGLNQTFKPQQAAMSEDPPVIPNTGSSGVSTPIKRKPKSLSELRQFAKSLED